MNRWARRCGSSKARTEPDLLNVRHHTKRNPAGERGSCLLVSERLLSLRQVSSFWGLFWNVPSFLRRTIFLRPPQLRVCPHWGQSNRSM